MAFPTIEIYCTFHLKHVVLGRHIGLNRHIDLENSEEGNNDNFKYKWE